MARKIMRVKNAAGVSKTSITAFSALKLTNEVSTLPTLEFEVHKDATGANGLEVEGFVSFPVYVGETVVWDYVIKDIKYSNGYFSVFAVQDAEAIKNTPFPFYDVEGRLSAFIRDLNSAMSGQGWIFALGGSSDIGSRKCIVDENTTVWGAVTSLAEQVGARWVIEQRAQTSVPVTAVVFYAADDWPKTSSIRLFEDVNLKDFEKEYSTDGVITKICPIGKDGLLLDGTKQQRMTVPSEANWITDTSKFNKIVPAWVKFDDVETTAELRTQAQAYLQTVNSPFVSYSITALDLRRLTGSTLWPQLDVGTYVEFLDKSNNVVVSSQICKVELDLLNPENNTVEISNVAQSFISSAAAERTQLANTTKIANEALALAKEGGGGGGSTSWANITGKPSTFPPSSHTHTKAEITDFAHTHTKSQITDFAHNHDERYYTETEIDNKIDGLKDDIDDKQDKITSSNKLAYSLLSGTPTIPTTTSELTNNSGFINQRELDNALDSKQDTLVSGVDIKTVNNQSLLGSGNIDIQGGGGSGADYVTEVGASGIWQWRKWNSGKIECWGNQSFSSIALTTQKAGGVYTNNTWAAYSFNLPDNLFTDSPLLFCSVNSNGYTQCQAISTSTTAVSMRMWSSYSATVTNVNVRLLVIGQ